MKSALRSRVRAGTAASTAPRPNVCDDGQRPSFRDGMANHIAEFLFRKNRNIFSKGAGRVGQISCRADDADPSAVASAAKAEGAIRHLRRAWWNGRRTGDGRAHRRICGAKTTASPPWHRSRSAFPISPICSPARRSRTCSSACAPPRASVGRAVGYPEMKNIRLSGDDYQPRNWLFPLAP